MDPVTRQLVRSSLRPSQISFVNAVAAAPSSSTITLTGLGLANNDLMIIMGDRDGSATPPTLPVGWTNINTNSTGVGARAAYKLFNSSTDTSVVLTNSTTSLLSCYRGVNTTTPIGNNAVRYLATGGTFTYDAINVAVDGSSWIVGSNFIVTVSGTTNTVPTGWTLRGFATDSTDQGTLVDSNGTIYDYWNGFSWASGNGNDTILFTIEIISN